MHPYGRRILYAFIACSLARGSLAGAQDEQICTINQRHYELSFQDLPDVRTDFVLCLDSRLAPTLLAEYVHCRMYWKLADINEEGQRRCADYDYLYPTDEHPFTRDTLGQGEVCLVRQVTEAQHAKGESGWYYLDDATQRCSGTGAGAVFPLNHPERFDLVMQCGVARAPDGEYSSVDIHPAQCVAPPSAADASDVGKECSQAVVADERAQQLTFGGDSCSSAVCLTTPLGQLVCTERNGIGVCGSSTTRCSCRCAGESVDDPGPFCACPDSYECKPLLSSYVGSPETRGSYCVPSDGRVVP